MELHATLAHYPEVPGFKEGTTSVEAACKVASKAQRLQDQCLEYVNRMGPCTADECAAGLNESILSIRPRFSQLRTLGKIADTKERRKNASGHRAIVWRATGALKQSEMDL